MNAHFLYENYKIINAESEFMTNGNKWSRMKIKSTNAPPNKPSYPTSKIIT